MSGGSYDYFYSRATEKASSIASTLSDMASVAKKLAQSMRCTIFKLLVVQLTCSPNNFDDSKT